MLTERGIETRIPYTVDEDGFYTADAPGFEGKRVITDKGDKGDANDAVIAALVAAGNILARGRLKHQYPHSWRSKKPVIFRNTPQWFIAMDRPLDRVPLGSHGSGEPEGSRSKTLREIALAEIAPGGTPIAAISAGLIVFTSKGPIDPQTDRQSRRPPLA